MLRSIRLYYGVSVCTTEYQFVLRSMSLHYGVSVCTTEYISICTTEYQFVLRSVSRGCLVRVCGLAFVPLRSSDPPSPLSSSITITPLPPIHPSPPPCVIPITPHNKRMLTCFAYMPSELSQWVGLPSPMASP